MGEAYHVLTGDKLTEFHHARSPIRYSDDDVDTGATPNETPISVAQRV